MSDIAEALYASDIHALVLKPSDALEPSSDEDFATLFFFPFICNSLYFRLNNYSHRIKSLIYNNLETHYTDNNNKRI